MGRLAGAGGPRDGEEGDLEKVSNFTGTGMVRVREIVGNLTIDPEQTIITESQCLNHHYNELQSCSRRLRKDKIESRNCRARITRQHCQKHYK